MLRRIFRRPVDDRKKHTRSTQRQAALRRGLRAESLEDRRLLAADYIFTTAGAWGRFGPTQADINSAYAGTSLAGQVIVGATGIQEWLVPTSGTFRVEACGAQGASADPGFVGGKGACVSGDFTLSAGTQMKIAVGQTGVGQSSDSNGGGGGGSFVVAGATNTPLLIAAGGGGTRTHVSQNGIGGQVSQFGTVGSGGSTTNPGTLKTSGLGQGGVVSSQSWGSAGGGFYSDGADDSPWGTGGGSWFNGLVGGSGSGCGVDAFGGFGGGGAGNGCYGGGGGGGYSGGDGGRVAGGGGSYNVGANPTGAAGLKAGTGMVSFSLLNSPPIAEAGASYTVAEGGTVVLVGTGSDPDEDSITFEWDLDGDNIFGEVAGARGNETLQSPGFSAVGLDGPSSFVVSLRTRDDNNAISQVDTATINITNVAPTVAVSGMGTVDEGSAYSLNLGMVTDPGNDTVSNYIVHWGDGTSDTYATAGVKTHEYADGPNNYVISVDLVDEDVYQGLDPSFGQGGKVISDFGTSYFAGAMTLDSQVRVIVLADAKLVRYKTDGSLDQTFGINGKLQLPYTGIDVQGLAIDHAGRFLVIGRTFTFDSSISGQNWDIAVARYNSNGMLDNSFGTGGIKVLEVSGPTTTTVRRFDYGQGIALNAAGEIFIAGYTEESFNSPSSWNQDIVVAKLTSAGALDPSFGNQGLVRYDFKSSGQQYSFDQAEDITILSNGDLVIVGSTDQIGKALLRLTPQGELVGTFGNGGRAQISQVVPYFTSYQPTSVAEDAEGRLVVGGFGYGMPNVSNYDFMMTRYTANGERDPSFANNGIAAIHFGFDKAVDIQVDAQGRIVIAGDAQVPVGTGWQTNIAVARWIADAAYRAVAELTVTVANVAPTPTIVSIGTPRVEGTAIAVSGSASDPAGSNDTLSFAWSVFKNGALFTTDSGSSFSFTPDDNGSYKISLTVSDEDGGSSTVDSTIIVDNVAPIPTIMSIGTPRVEGTAIAVSGSATDPAGANDTLSYAWSVLKNGALFTTDSGSSFSFTPDDNGSYKISLTVSDEDGGSTTVDSTITVDNVAPTPTIVSIGTPRVEGTAIAVSGGATDPGIAVANDGVSYAWSVYKDGSSTEYATGVGSSWSFTPDDNGSYRIVLTATDKDGESDTAEETINVANVAPTVATPLSIGSLRVEGTSIAVSGGATDPGSAVANDGVSYAWSVYKDGSSTEYATGSSSSWSFTPDDNGSYRIVLTATDKDGASDTAEQTITVDNVNPTATANSYVIGQATLVAGNVITENSGSGVDSDPAGVNDALVVISHTSPANGALVLNSDGTFTYKPDTTFSGADSFSYTISDGDGGTSTATVAIHVSASVAGSITTVYDSCLEGSTALLITGTSADDLVAVEPGATSETLTVTVNGVRSTVTKPTGRIIVTGGAGNDNIQIAGAVTNTVWLYGDAGNDRLNAGSGGSLLIGGDGNDHLLGGGGRDVMIGGEGADNLIGNSNDDILIAGYTIKDSRSSTNHEEFWCDVMKEWNSNRSFDQRVADLSGKLLPSVVDDLFADSIDMLNGASGDDWLIFAAGEDKVSGKAEASN